MHISYIAEITDFIRHMSEQGWTKYHLFMRGSKWTKDADTIIHDSDGWHLNGPGNRF